MTGHLRTPKDVADWFAVSEDRIRKLVNAKAIPHIRLGREIRFTDDHIQQISKLFEVAPIERDPGWGSKRTTRRRRTA